MNNLMRGRQGFYQNDSSRFGPFSQSSTASSSSCSSSSTAASSLHHHHKGIPLSYYSYQPRGPTPTPWDETGGLRCYNVGGRGGAISNSSHQIHDHLMISSPGTSNINNLNIVDDADPHHHHQESSDEHINLFVGTPRGGGGESSEGPSGGGIAGGGNNNSMLVSIEREHMFDKVVTPSDVGKLNRLVIPKQHAEKYFPLDSSTNEKGLLLNFEDRNGKPWRFRYSYWNSSQSYVMTKGWSRFVKEKKLDAGDIVSFQRGLGELGKDRLFIDWRRRPDAPPPPHHHPSIPAANLSVVPHHQFSFHQWSHPPFYLQHQQPPPPPPPLPSRDQHNYATHLLQLNSNTNTTNDITHQYHYQSHHHLNSSSHGYTGSVMTGNPYCSAGSLIYLNNRSTTTGGGAGAAAAARLGSGGVGIGMGSVVQKDSGSSLVRGIIHHKEEDEINKAVVFESVPVVQGKASSAKRRLRLFGVNMDCPISEESSFDNRRRQEDQYCNNILCSTTVMPAASASQCHYPSSSPPPPLNLRHPYNNATTGTPLLLRTMPTGTDLLNEGKASTSLDLDI